MPVTPSKNRIFGIDIGGSGIKGAPVDVKKGVLLAERHRIPTPQPATPEAVAQTVAEVMAAHEWSGPLGCTIPARVRNGVTETAMNIDKAWIGCKAEKLLSKVTGHPVTILNDADAAGIAEMRCGAGRKQKGKVLMLTFGTGIGSALFMDGVLIPNVELGSARWQKKSILEDFASDRARSKNHLTWERWGKKRVQPVLEHLEFLFSPDLIIIGGGVSKPEKWSLFADLLKTKARLRPAALGNEAGIVGAAMAARDRVS
ncbi:polyphosphate--glucose phosphotransferase [Rubricoccus marinus]|uniref:Polyphosphate glucokinase n=1 Tax=Rubricoccus marinus TaxID=716817 RepID=A0A259TXB3_9BACT|nr:ROK family protein [Rubricoccus marinus]OZC02336.1 polyphosphate glucokinase [Rubricoccus marinus]